MLIFNDFYAMLILTNGYMYFINMIFAVKVAQIYF